ncbi:hypothetical protein PV10_04966 [Exophiala mesophila]|uniref:Uncharacterized protein n=1 Tax=Exophiala mesophila TaxID=212818 RepID=A0A0D2A450_EXOME|nr:uncharacterized protein PV10_04966 [Exophiala mesophila]KIV93778.1 hypothetical protein PV10_04966 [Exophiala mesophila]
MNYQVTILLAILCAIFVVLLCYAFWQMSHKQKLFSKPARGSRKAFSPQQQQYMRSQRMRNLQALAELADIEAGYGAETEYTTTASMGRFNPPHDKSIAGSTPGHLASNQSRQDIPARQWQGQGQG